MSIEYVAGGAFVLLLISVSLWAYDEAVNPKNVIFRSEEGVRFPKIRGTTVSGKVLILPEGIEGEFALLLIAFQPHHDLGMDAWKASAQRLSEQFQGFVYYELATVERDFAVAHASLDSEMRAGLSNLGVRETILTLYLNKADFRQALDIQNEDEITVLLIDSDGQILWRTSGPTNSEKESQLRRFIAPRLTLR